MSRLSPTVCRFHFPLLLLLSVSLALFSRAEAEPGATEWLTVSYQPQAEERVLDAVIEAVNKATVSAQTSGRVTKIYFDVDDVVKKGDVLLRMRDREQRARFNAAKARHTEAEAEYQRVKEVHAKKLVARSQLDKAEARLKSAKATMEQAQESLENTIIRAPYNGILVKRYIEVGETARVGKPLFTGLSLESLRAAVNLPQDLITVVRQLKRARVISSANENRSIEAESMIISPYADPDSHTFLLRVNLPPGQHGLYPGMAVKVAFMTREVKKLLVPVSAVAYRSEVSAVYVKDKNGRVSMRQVRLGRVFNDMQIEILAGLQADENIAEDPLAATIYLKEQSIRPDSGSRP
ncbi:hypothetical protein MNBD_GAMMA25-958 [hydrothermal vent metagenome]|uniref:Uncharacterized protein n=1 Tax=hydrothermal vent metagenome TaxID=652676 RepID=A0A3B1BG37_9ZZZZ